MSELQTKPRARQIDWASRRSERQKINNLKVFNAIKERNMSEFYKNVNDKELERVLDETGLTREELIAECAKEGGDLLCRMTSGRISINSSRQGTKDEELQMDISNTTSSQFGINIENLSTTAYRPTKNGLIVSGNEMKERKIHKDACLKSFDAKISGKMEGWIFAKVVFGSGGYQDSMFQEADSMCEWVSKYKQDGTELYVIMLDTDLTDKFDIIKNKYISTKNLMVTNHYDFQNHIIDKYYQPSI
jgi:hypothetical protein